MKMVAFYLFILLIGEVFCDDKYVGIDHVNPDGYLVGLKKDEEKHIFRPCKLEDWSCIRSFLAHNSDCTPVEGPAPDPLVLEKDTVYLPSVHINVVLKNVQTSGLNDVKVREFYVNKYTGNVVIALDVKGLSERSSDTIMKYLRTAKEPVILADYSTVTYELITFTAVIPKVPHLDLSKAEIHANVVDSKPPYAVGPKAYVSTDPLIRKAYDTLTNTLPLIFKESFLLKSKYLTNTIIQNKICDFRI